MNMLQTSLDIPCYLSSRDTILTGRNNTFVGIEHQKDKKYRFLFQAYDFALNKVLSSTILQKDIVQNKWKLQSNNLENSFVVPIRIVRCESFSSNEQSALFYSVRNVTDLIWYSQWDPLQFTTVVTTVHVSLKAKFFHRVRFISYLYRYNYDYYRIRIAATH